MTSAGILKRRKNRQRNRRLKSHYNIFLALSAKCYKNIQLLLQIGIQLTKIYWLLHMSLCRRIQIPMTDKV